MTLRERFDAKWCFDPTTGCWVWTASKHPLGYGHLMIGSRTDRTKRPGRAHRISYELYKGPIPEGLELDHLCRNTSCVNPDHLEPVTHEENMRRGLLTEICRVRAARTHCVNGHSFEIHGFIRADGVRGCRECRRQTNRLYRKNLKTKGVNDVRV